MIILKTAAELERMRRAGEVTARALARVAETIRPGITTRELDRVAEEAIRAAGGIPAFKGYRGYPASICASVNEVVIHGIPGDRRLEEGDIISIDIGAVVDGYYGDMARTYPVGAVSEQARRLLEVTWEALERAIAAAQPGRRVSDISWAVQSYVEAHGFSVVRDFTGHGIGRQMHEDPSVPNYGRPGRGPRLEPGMVLAIEPMVTQGNPSVRVLGDGWTAVTADGSLAAHFEDTVAIREDGVEILTRPYGE
ncbi:MAG: type I methionyl aminopeptidase [Limnochordales bacterium]|nr:type I methionyl aminopeptidase [Limnochordales bacterium]